MKKDVYDLVNQELHGDNLKELARLCANLFDQNPSLYGTLAFIFQDLADEYGEQGIALERYQAISDSIRQPILNLLDAEGKSCEAFLVCLNEVLTAFKNLKT